ncbi:MAG TPA: SgcJ/EcaC family oxidoreductase [Geminicoccaceae bacterium]|nr:SgcJ/EcaC family oxidoreductase [Geminicoccaceae bacterium]
MDARSTVATSNEKWNSAFNAGEATAVAALYTVDATVLPHTHDVMRGVDAIRDFWKSVIEAGFKNHSIELIDVHAQENLIVEIAKWQAEGPGEGGRRQSFGGSLVNVFERQGDGSWKCRLHIWN